MRITWVQHVDFEGLGSIERWALSRGHDLVRVRPYAGETLDVDAGDLLVVMGGPMGACDTAEHPWLAAEKDLVRSMVADGRGVLGVCLGAQVIADALGGAVGRNPQREIGWFDVTLTAAGRACPVLGTLPVVFDAFHWHGDTFSPPPGAVRAATSEACAHQAFSMDGGRVVGLQLHLEPTPSAVADLVAACGSDLAPGPYVWGAEALLAVPPERYAAANALLDGVLDAIEARLR